MKLARRFARALRRGGQAEAPTGVTEGILAALGPEQRAFVADDSPRKSALCGRRAGKSHGVAAWLLLRGLQAPDGLSAFVALRRSSARAILVSAIKKIAAAAGTGTRVQNEDGQLYVVLDNGHRIWIAGCPHAGEIEKFRGIALWSAAVDECGFMAGFLEELVDGVLDATLLDHQGKLVLTSSPGVVPTGYFYNVTTTAEGWSRHQWTVLQNAAIPHAAEWLNARKRRFGWTDTTPIYLREWLGRWVSDAAGLVYPFSRSVNAWDGQLPEGHVTTVIGVDVGYVDAMAFVVASAVAGTGKKYIRQAEKQSGMTPNAVVVRVRQLLELYPGSLVVVDEGGAGKGYAVHLREEGIGCIAATKTEKRAHQEWMAGDILIGNILVNYEASKPLLDECLVLRWGENGQEDPRFDNHDADAALYACRQLRVAYVAEKPPPVPGSREHDLAIRDKHRALREKQVRDALRRKGRLL